MSKRNSKSVELNHLRRRLEPVKVVAGTPGSKAAVGGAVTSVYGGRSSPAGWLNEASRFTKEANRETPLRPYTRRETLDKGLTEAQVEESTDWVTRGED